MRILVTGGAGFIGSRLVDELIKIGDKVVVLDNLSTGNRHVNPAAIFVHGDITDRDAAASAIRGCKAVFNLAALTDVRTLQKDPKRAEMVNVIGSKNVFDAAKRESAKVIFASSAAVYGNSKVPIREDSTTKPVSEYGKGKLAAEKLAPSGSFIARMFNVYGPRGHSAINTFCEAIAEDRAVIIYGGGNQTRDWIFVDDAVRALMFGLKHSGTYNVATGKETSVVEIVRTIESALGKKAAIEFKPHIEGEIDRSVADTSKIKNLGFNPRYDVETGIGELKCQKI